MTTADRQKEHTHTDQDDHLVEARLRARSVLSGESHLGAVDDWRHVLVTARDTVLLLWLVFVAGEAFLDHQGQSYVLLAFAVGAALLLGLSAGRATLTQVQYHVAELERERKEIRENFEHERDEVRTLYEAKGFEEPLLGQIVDTLCADDDRLLKVMMEEELGIAMHHINHPLIVGVWNFAASLVVGLVLALPIMWFSDAAAHWWVLGSGGLLLIAISWATARATGRGTPELVATALLMAVVAGGTVHFLSRWLATLGAGGASAG